MRRKISGATLLEILMAMLVIALVAGGMLTAFVFSRRVSWRSGSELSGVQLVREIADQLREVMAGTAPAGLILDAGVYVDQKLGNAGPFAGQDPAFIPPSGVEGTLPTPLAALNLPADFEARYQTVPGTAATFAAHGDGRLYVVEDAPVDANGNGRIDPPERRLADLDGDGLTGIDFIGDGRQTHLRRVRVKLRWTTPES